MFFKGKDLLNWVKKKEKPLDLTMKNKCVAFTVHHSLLHALVLYIVQIDQNVTLFTCFCIFWIKK